MLPVTVPDETRSIDAITFSVVAKDLVEQNAYLTSQNLKIDALDHVVALDKTIGKTRLFNIGTSSSGTFNFAIKYELKKSYNVHPSGNSITLLQRYFNFFVT
jgi:hypothetical protein